MDSFGRSPFRFKKIRKSFRNKLYFHSLYVAILYNEISSIIIFFECLKAPFIEAFVHYYNFFLYKSNKSISLEVHTYI